MNWGTKVFLVLVAFFSFQIRAEAWDEDTQKAAQTLQKLTIINYTDELIVRHWGGPNGEAMEFIINEYETSYWLADFHFKLKKLIQFWVAQSEKLPEGDYRDGVLRALTRALRFDEVLNEFLQRFPLKNSTYSN